MITVTSEANKQTDATNGESRTKTAHAFFMTGNGGSIVSRPLGLREWLVAVVGGWVGATSYTER